MCVWVCVCVGCNSGCVVLCVHSLSVSAYGMWLSVSARVCLDDCVCVCLCVREREREREREKAEFYLLQFSEENKLQKYLEKYRHRFMHMCVGVCTCKYNGDVCLFIYVCVL